MWRAIVLFVLVNSIYCDEEEVKTVVLEEGIVKGEKYWDGDFYRFYGIPYASVPTGRDKFQVYFTFLSFILYCPTVGQIFFLMRK